MGGLLVLGIMGDKPLKRRDAGVLLVVCLVALLALGMMIAHHC